MSPGAVHRRAKSVKFRPPLPTEKDRIMTMSLDKGPALISDLQRDASQLADNDKVSDEQFRRTVGRIGLLLCDVARNAVSNEEARGIAVDESKRAAESAVGTHVIVCRRDSAMPSSWRGAAMLALSKSPVPFSIALVVLVLAYHPPALLQRLIGP